MQETISMPGVYSSEVNQTFNSPIQLPDGCAIIGPTQKGEAYVPTSVQSLGQFSQVPTEGVQDLWLSQSEPLQHGQTRGEETRQLQENQQRGTTGAVCVDGQGRVSWGSLH